MKFISWHADKHRSFLQVDSIILLLFMDRNAQSTRRKKFAYLCNISRKTREMKLIFCLQINAKVLYQLIVFFFCICIARHAQSTQSNKFAIFLQYLKENVNDEVDFLHADKHRRFLQIDAIIFGLCGQAYPNYPK